jgi:hypothetical protein
MSIQARIARLRTHVNLQWCFNFIFDALFVICKFCQNFLVSMASSAHSNFRALSCRTGSFEANANAHFCATGKEYVHEEMEAGVPHRKEDAECLRDAIAGC